MSTISHSRQPGISGGTHQRDDVRTHDVHDPIFQAFMLLRIGFTVAPIVFGLDKFAHALVNWDIYLAPRLDNLLPGTAHQFMYVVGVIEVVAGLVVALRPKYGSLLVAGWLAGIIVNLLLIPGFYDVALRDFGLLLAALTLFRLASVYDARPLLRRATPMESR
ncbi:MAG: hypothetical protein QOC98_2643 [Frankiaceae bacterium]|nr:hypothetical protein [Frankiaceae bacterium]